MCMSDCRAVFRGTTATPIILVPPNIVLCLAVMASSQRLLGGNTLRGEEREGRKER